MKLGRESAVDRVTLGLLACSMGVLFFGCTTPRGGSLPLSRGVAVEPAQELDARLEVTRAPATRDAAEPTRDGAGDWSDDAGDDGHIVRYQSGDESGSERSIYETEAVAITPGSTNQPRQPMAASGQPRTNVLPIASAADAAGRAQPTQYWGPPTGSTPGPGQPSAPSTPWGTTPSPTPGVAVPTNNPSAFPAYPTPPRYGPAYTAQAPGPPGTGGYVVPPAGPIPGQSYPVGPPGPSVPATAVPVVPVQPGWPGARPATPGGALPSSPFAAPDPSAVPFSGGPPVLPPGTDPRFTDVIVDVQEAPTGRLMIGAAVNSDAGVTGQIVVDERNFDWRRVPTSWDDVVSGRAFRGAGQAFRLEALPGNQFQRYSVSFTEPFLFNSRVSLDLAAFLYDRTWFDWNEGRFGGKAGLGYRITPDLSVSFQIRGEQVDLTDPRVPGIPELDASLGKSDLFGGRVALAHDTRDIPFSPTQGHYFEVSFEQVFGDFDYPRGSIDYRRYFLVTERADGSGRHVLGFSNRVSITGSDTPIFDNFFAGGYSTLRGFEIRGASPNVNGVFVGGELLFLGSVEYLFPITADDMLKGVVFVDYGTVEEDINIRAENYRVALGAGFRISIPAMGPAPIAIDFAVPVARADADQIQNVSFFVGFSR